MPHSRNASNSSLDIDEVAEHIKGGKLPTQLAMTWAGRVSFVLTEALTLKKIQLLDVVMEGAGVDAAQSGKENAGFDADVAISTGELRQLMPALIEALGGLHERQAAPGELAAGAAPSPGATTSKSAPRAGSPVVPPWEEQPS